MTSHYLKPKESLEYNPHDVNDVVKYAQKLLNKSLNEVMVEKNLITDFHKSSNKGAFGLLLEELYFSIKNNSDSEPDIIESGIEIKSAQVKVSLTNKKTFKERLKISSINYENSFNYSNLFESPLWKKIERILLMLFIYRDGADRLDDICDFADLLIFPEEDITQFAKDWNTIKTLVQNNRANEITEGLTYYLSANTSGRDSKDLVDAPGGLRVKRRAFSLKSAYLNELFRYKPPKLKAKIGKLKAKKNKTLEQSVIEELYKYQGKSCQHICEHFNLDYSSLINAKDYFSRVSKLINKLILSNISENSTEIPFEEFEQFNKAGIIIKTVALEENGNLKESMSFPAIKWVELAEEDEWEESQLYDFISRKFLFYVYKKNAEYKNPTFVTAFFWSMPQTDIDKMQELWGNTKEKVLRNEYGSFLTSTQHSVGHVRPHAKNALDLAPTPQNTMEKKKSFWLNRVYILNVIKNHLNRVV